MKLPQTVELKGIRVLTTKQLAKEYGVAVQKLKQNFANNRKRFIDGKHYISLTGDELKVFKNQVEKIDLVDGRTSHLYLWTEKGALLHAKSLNTDKAWEVYDYLVDFYFRAKDKQVPVPVTYINEERKSLDSKKAEKKEPYDIAPAFREIISILPLEALDAIEHSLRGDNNLAIRLAALSVLAEKMKRRMN